MRNEHNLDNNLIESEEKYRSLVENLNEILYVLDENAHISYITPNIEALSGYSIDEVIGRSFIQFVHPDDLEGRIENFRKAISGLNQASEYRFLTKSKRVKWVRTAARPKKKNGRITGVQGVLTDITDRKEAEEQLQRSEERYRTVFENTGTAMVIIEEDDSISLINKRFEELSGYRREEIEGKMNWKEFVKKDELHTMQEYRTARKEGENDVPKNYEFGFVVKDGTVKDVLLEVSMTPDKSKTVCSLIDITERKRTEQEQEQLQAHLYNVQKRESIGRLAGGVAHDLNNVLGAILGYADLGKRQISPQNPLYSRLEKILNLTDRGARITRQLLTFSQRHDVELQNIDLNILISDILKLIDKTLGEHVRVKYNPADNLRTVSADAGQIDQVLMNLCINARDAMPEGGELTISTKNIDIDENYARHCVNAKPGKYIVVSVSDTGAGIPEDHIQKIFDPFFTTKGPDKGTGLGLSVVDGVVSQHKGFINVESEVGVGTTFNIYIPAVEEAPLANIEKVSNDIPVGSETVLVVEDDEGVVSMIQSILEHQGYSALTAGDGEEGLKLFKEKMNEIDLVVSDVVMPNMSGPEMYEHIKSTKPEIPFLFISGYTADMISNKFIIEKGIDFIAKPFNNLEFGEKVYEVLNR